MRHCAAQHRGGTQHPLSRRRELRHPGGQHLTDRRRQRESVRASGEQLLGEERVARRALHQPARQPGRRRHPGDRLHQRAHPGAVQRRQDQPLGVWQPRQLADQDAHRPCRVKLLRPDGDHQQHRIRADPPGQERNQATGRRIRPVQILHHQHQRGFRRDRAHRVRRGGEQPRRPERVCPPGRILRQQPGGCWRVKPGQRVKDAEHWRVRGVGGERDTPAGEYPHPVHLDGEVLDQAGLADPGITFNQHQPAPAAPRIRQRGAERGYLRRPPD
jgi:hypothetical protein